MRLTGKCKEDFCYWWVGNPKKIKGVSEAYYNGEKFESLPYSMQYGVYLDFFDSVGIRIVIDIDFENEVYDKFALYIEYKKHSFCSYGMNFKTRQEARTEGIEKANEIYNLK